MKKANFQKVTQSDSIYITFLKFVVARIRDGGREGKWTGVTIKGQH